MDATCGLSKGQLMLSPTEFRTGIQRIGPLHTENSRRPLNLRGAAPCLAHVRANNRNFVRLLHSVVLGGEFYRPPSLPALSAFGTRWRFSPDVHSTVGHPEALIAGAVAAEQPTRTSAPGKQPRPSGPRPLVKPGGRRGAQKPRRFAGAKPQRSFQYNLKRRAVGNSLTHEQLAERLLQSPQLQMDVAAFPLLSSLMPPFPLQAGDLQWMEDNLEEVYCALQLPPLAEMMQQQQQQQEEEDVHSPLKHLDTLLYLSFMHKELPGKRRHVLVAHTRLAYLGASVADLALVEFLLQRYPRETPPELRERSFGMLHKKKMPAILTAIGLARLVYEVDPEKPVSGQSRLAAAKSVLCALVATLYLTGGLPAVYRFLFAICKLDPDCPEAKPWGGRPRDEDHVSAELEEKQLVWQDIAAYRPPPGALFAHPRLFRACVPPGMHRFNDSDWAHSSLALVLNTLQYPRPRPRGTDVRLKQACNEELVLALQLAFMHPSLHKSQHPRFCCERLGYLGRKIQDLVLWESLLMEHLDGPGLWLADRHRRLLRNSACGRNLRAKGLDKAIQLETEWEVEFRSNAKLRRSSCAEVSQALSAVGYLVYGKLEVKRLLSDIWRIFDK